MQLKVWNKNINPWGIESVRISQLGIYLTAKTKVAKLQILYNGSFFIFELV